ncbi:hypothetical protein GCM10007989_03260 [Devosia pacifica]|uniref:Uncharacterized protein n=1 Tax=Devosia pacifica TaxID=1335967 RepID=A0A918VP75_9HYPH|nr:hypothetical protein [Devosia pacifica]GHA12176.1 hypothetical protein GCM10007989_03260 [Devosia pacifica]
MNFMLQGDTVAKSDKPLLLSVAETRDEDSVTRTMTLDGQQVFFRIAGVTPAPLQCLDFAVIASIFTAMRLGRPLHVAGPVSRTLLANIEEFQDAWHNWLPKQYKTVPVTADTEITEIRSDKNRSVVAFSGGLDSAYSILVHARGAVGRRSVAPAAGVLVHGLDIPLSSTHAFASAAKSARTALKTLDVPLATVTTNWREQLCHNWRMEHMAGVVASLNQFHGLADVAVVGSDEGYDEIDIPWGSNYVTNPLLSGAMQLRTEGGAKTRTERLAFVAANSELADKIRVCWENPDTGGNCGVCEKCVSTQLNYLAAGIEPQGFAKRATWWTIASAPVRSKGDLYFLLESHKAANRRGLHGMWRVAQSITILRHILARPRLWLLDEVKAAIRRNESLYRRLRPKGKTNE